ncbi:hypothetical protein NCU06074 [Neurospora crassa OR74A]|uniref:Uncharacterized protein n=1 Tax=Neurospora crassa (strain ATCC 24698 / 74-OR23-1A / CBS 708.71 / DSM 1257 / FGSC 987) TaxID=367110 RepID=Q7S4X6_NEUCR|nr:hypothetical protein NCU06074 [Neurospora crassa OR74A]EAA30601.2 hypothetical protein NCU06074 [Neurospora crassa OR74A]|eukprot:XP_959837.2 hypothetical protein NCU06074 [Neurospora crassa OR74A]
MPLRKQNARNTGKAGPKMATKTTKDDSNHQLVPIQSFNTFYNVPAPAPVPSHPFAHNDLLKSLLPHHGYDYSMFHLVHPDGINHENYLAIEPEHADCIINALFKSSGGMEPYGYGYNQHVGNRAEPPPSSHLNLVVESGLTTLFNALHDVASELDLAEMQLIGNDTDKAGAGYLSPFWEKVVTNPKYSGAWFHVDVPQGHGHGQGKPNNVGTTKWKVPKSWTGYLRTNPPMTRARGREATVPYLCSMSRPNPEEVHFFPSGTSPGPGYKPLTTLNTSPGLSSSSTSEALHKACLALHSLTALILDAREYVIERPGRFPSRNLPSSDPLVLAIDQFRNYLESVPGLQFEESIQQAFYSYHATVFRLELPVAAGLFGGNGTTMFQFKPAHVSRDTGKVVDESVMVASVSSAGSSDVDGDEDEEDRDLSSDTESDYACSSYARFGSAKKFRR